MTKKQILAKTKNYIKKLMASEGTGHDWYHIERVVRNAKLIAKKEKGDLFIIELAARLHDIADWKFHGGDHTVGPKKAREWLESLKVDQKIIDEVSYIVEHISYRGGTNTNRMKTIEGKIVQDADRLDAMGAIGISRLFAFGGSVGRPIYDPKIKLKKYLSFSHFKKNLDRNFKNHSINHFYEKLLLLKDKMNTKAGKKLAIEKHKFMENYLKQFYKEWGK